MRVLALDTSLENCAAAVLDNDLSSGSTTVCQAEIGRGHAERLITMIGDVMAESSTAFTDLDRLVVTTGPGSFTGLRVGLSVARGFGLVLERPVVGITTLAAIAASVPAATEDVRVLVALTGKGEEVYAQMFDGAGNPIDGPSVRTLSDLSATLAAGTRLAGSAARSIASSCGFPADSIVCSRAYPDIAEVARLGILADPNETAAVPLYLRPPDATPQTGGKIERLQDKAN